MNVSTSSKASTCSRTSCNSDTTNEARPMSLCNAQSIINFQKSLRVYDEKSKFAIKKPPASVPALAISSHSAIAE
uniref:Uncharacterized protein n=1 Tax=Globodera rostochiensis TaxID=31243 RepID=A0A914GXP0_GLORO